MKFIRDDNYLMIIERIMKLAMPFIYAWVLGFYAFFHCWMNFLAELTRFSDRNFYKDWWNSIYLDEYWRTWNLVNKINFINIFLYSAYSFLAFKTCLQSLKKKKI